jgi:hypothetical protein
MKESPPRVSMAQNCGEARAWARTVTAGPPGAGLRKLSDRDINPPSLACRLERGLIDKKTKKTNNIKSERRPI